MRFNKDLVRRCHSGEFSYDRRTDHAAMTRYIDLQTIFTIALFTRG